MDMTDPTAWLKVKYAAANLQPKLEPPTPFPWPLPNVWKGVTAENQHWADARIPVLLDTPAAVRFVSVEPCLGPVDLDGFLPLRLLGRHDWRGCVCEEIDPADRPCIVCEARGGLDWVIVGGESGPKRRPFDVAWARSIAAQCKAAGVTCFAKQGSGPRPGAPFGDAALDALKEFPEVQL
jgi:protein gp37